MKKTSHINPNNGGAKPPLTDAASSVSAPEGDDGVVVLREEDQKIIRELDQEMLRLKLELANVTAQTHVMQLKQGQLAQQLVDTDRGFFERVKKTAGEYGLDLDKQKWNFDASKMAFSKMA